MKVLYINTPAFGKEDMLEAMNELDLSVTLFSHDDIFKRNSTAVETALSSRLEDGSFSFVFSFNYFPCVSRCCQTYRVPYISYVYDSPLLSLFSCSVMNNCNYIFLFDRALYERLYQDGITTVYYLPLAANPTRLEQITPSQKAHQVYDADLSFVGSMYNESHHLFERLEHVNPYVKGYLDAIMAAQLQISGYFMIEELLTPQIVQELQQVCPYHPFADGVESDAYVYANYFIARKLAELERTHILHILSQNHDCKLYTHQATPDLPHVKNMGPIDNYEAFPCVCKCSKINLNITLRSIQSGIPMRSWDILGAGGFLLSNYQADYDDLFVAGEDYIYFTDDADLLSKADYYLSHEKERHEIAGAGHQKVLAGNTFLHRIRYMMHIIHLI